MKNILVLILLISITACYNNRKVVKLDSQFAIDRFFNIYESSNYKQQRQLELRKNKTIARDKYQNIVISNEYFCSIVKKAFDAERANQLIEGKYGFFSVEFLVSNKGKVIGMQIKTAKGTDITDQEVKVLSQKLFKMRLDNPNDYSETWNGRFSFEDEYFEL